MQKRMNGFTLLELMVAVVIVAILAAIALPSYQRYVLRSARSSVQATMLNLAEDLTRYRARNLSYRGFVPRDGYSSSNIVVSPKGSTGTARQYLITIVDNDTGSALTPSSATLSSTNVVLGRRWAITAIPNSGNTVQATNKNILLTSDGVRCITQSNVAGTDFTARTGCDTGSETW